MTVFGTNVTELLHPASLSLPRSPRVVEIRHEPYTDWAGDEAMRVWVVLSDDTTDAQRRWARLAPIDGAIRDALLAAGVTLFPYITFRTRSEFRSEMRRRGGWGRET
jgi:hypothetical protein